MSTNHSFPACPPFCINVLPVSDCSTTWTARWQCWVPVGVLASPCPSSWKGLLSSASSPSTISLTPPASPQISATSRHARKCLVTWARSSWRIAWQVRRLSSSRQESLGNQVRWTVSRISVSDCFASKLFWQKWMGIWFYMAWLIVWLSKLIKSWIFMLESDDPTFVLWGLYF